MRGLRARFLFHARKLHLHIDKSALVLDIGSGNRPHPRADVLCDMFIEDGTHRQGKGIVKDERLMVQADICNLPFKDKAFGYAIASHVLEHIEDVQKATNELTRVAHSGYIETPSPLGELIFNRCEHKWLVEPKGGGLLFTSKEVLNQVPEGAAKIWNELKKLIETYPDEWHRFYFKTSDYWIVQHEWSDCIKMGIAVPSDRAPRAELPLSSFPDIPEAGDKKTLENSLYHICRNIIEWRHRRQRRARLLGFSLLEILQCPKCGGCTFGVESGSLSCPSCNACYLMKNGVINFLK